MPTTLVLKFEWGRYHANPWGRHVNEGAVELPPSPWRLLRALYAVWKYRRPGLDAEVVHDLLDDLAQPPVVHVPRHTIGHTRHYYPDKDHRKESVSTDRTLDTFAVFERGAEMAVEWPFTLTDAKQHVFETLAGSIPYFGRADSLCTGRVSKDWQPTDHATWVPVDLADEIADEAEVTSVIAPELPLRLESLLSSPAEVRRGGQVFPAGARLVGYQCPSSPPKLRPARATTKPRSVRAVRFSVLQAGLPPETDAVIYTDLLRQAALSKLGHRPEGTTLAGKNADNAKSESQHKHAHYLPVFRERRLDGLVAWVPEGIPDIELKALMSVSKLFSKINENWKLNIRVAGIGGISDVAPEFAGSSVAWRSMTPFTASRYPKKRDEDRQFMCAEVVRELKFRNVDVPVDVEVLDDQWAGFRRYRPSARRQNDSDQGRTGKPSRFMKIRFARPVSGPIALGHLSHFGLGLFVPDPHGQP